MVADDLKAGQHLLVNSPLGVMHGMLVKVLGVQLPFARIAVIGLESLAGGKTTIDVRRYEFIKPSAAFLASYGITDDTDTDAEHLRQVTDFYSGKKFDEQGERG